jgi:hypothetical protein
MWLTAKIDAELRVTIRVGFHAKINVGFEQEYAVIKDDRFWQETVAQFLQYTGGMFRQKNARYSYSTDSSVRSFPKVLLRI